MSDVIYYNLELNVGSSGIGSLTQEGNTPATINAQNFIPILDKTSDYYGSIVRMSVPQFNVPNAYFDVYVDENGNVPDVNKGIYNFTLEYGNNSATEYVNWLQTDFNFSPPLPNQPPKPSQYYFIWDYESFIGCWNTALSSAYASLQATVGAPLTADTPPFFYYNPNTQQIELYSVQSFSEPSSGDYLKIYCNNSLTTYIYGFRYFAFNDSVKSINIVLKSYPNKTNALNNVSIDGITYIKAMQEAPLLGYWNMLKNLIITTNMPVVQENFYQGFTSNPTQTNTSQNTILQSVLTDYIPDLFAGGSGAFVAGSQFIYNASSLWRIFQMVGDTPLYNIQCSIFFVDKNNVQWPLELFSKQAINIKFMFIKKNLIKNFFMNNFLRI